MPTNTARSVRSSSQSIQDELDQRLAVRGWLPGALPRPRIQ